MKKKFNEVKFQNITIKNFIKKNINNRYINWLNDPEVVKYSSQKKFKHTYKSCLKYYNKCQIENCYYLAIFIKKKHIGNIYCKLKSSKSISIRILLGDKNFWNKGMGFLIYKILINNFFHNLNYERVYSNTTNKNIGMIKIFKKLRKVYKYQIVKREGIVKAIYYKK